MFSPLYVVLSYSIIGSGAMVWSEKIKDRIEGGL
jgi:hypothetical protein